MHQSNFEKTVMVMIIVSIREERGEKIRENNKRPGMEIMKTQNERQEKWKEKDVFLLIAQVQTGAQKMEPPSPLIS